MYIETNKNKFFPIIDKKLHDSVEKYFGDGTNRNTKEPFCFVFIFDNKLKIKTARAPRYDNEYGFQIKNVVDVIDIENNQKYSNAMSKYAEIYRHRDDNKDWDTFRYLREKTNSIIFDNKFAVELKTKTIKDNWKNYISSSEMLDEIKKNLDLENKKEKTNEKER